MSTIDGATVSFFKFCEWHRNNPHVIVELMPGEGRVQALRRMQLQDCMKALTEGRELHDDNKTQYRKILTSRGYNV